METNNARKAHPLILAAAGALMLFAMAGTAALMGWLPDSRSDQTEQQALEKKATEKRSTASKTQSRPVQVVRGDLGVIDSVRTVTVKGEGTGLGAAIGGVAGGVAGHQIGGGRGKDVMTVVGVVGGGVAGHEAEKHLRGTKQYEVTVRFDDGTSKTYLRSNPPSFKPGDRVRVIDGDIQYV